MRKKEGELVRLSGSLWGSVETYQTGSSFVLRNDARHLFVNVFSDLPRASIAPQVAAVGLRPIAVEGKVLKSGVERWDGTKWRVIILMLTRLS